MKIGFSRPTIEPLESRLLLDASAILVKDVGSALDRFQFGGSAAMGGDTYFAADDGTGDVELWKSDGTQGGTTRVHDVRNGSASSSPSGIIATRDRVFFEAATNDVDRELWSTDGTVGGTRVVGRFDPGWRFDFTVATGDRVFFVRETEESGEELWTSDGTIDGTRMVRDIVPGVEGSEPTGLQSTHGKLYFSADGPDGITGIWESDGTEEGTKFLTSSNGFGFWRVQSSLFYSTSAPAAVHEYHLGTNQTRTVYQSTSPDSVITDSEVGETKFITIRETEDTFRVMNFDGDSMVPLHEFTNRVPRQLTVVGDLTYFDVDGTLWRSDGTPEGTSPFPNVEWVNPQLSVADGRLYIVSEKQLDVGVLASIDRDQVEFLDFTPDDETSYATVFLGNDGRVFAWRSDMPGLWVTDGTQRGTKGINASLIGPTVGMATGLGLRSSQLTSVADGVLFEANGGLWHTDGTAEGTHQIIERTQISNPITYRGKAYFSIRRRLWVSDGTPEGTKQMLTPDGQSHRSFDHNFTISGDRMYFFGGPSGFQLLRTDGTVEGTKMLARGQFHRLTNVNGTLYFVGFHGDGRYDLWKSDGTAEGTHRVAILDRFQLVAEVKIFGVANHVIVTDGDRTWRSDGTEEGTVELRFSIPNENVGVVDAARTGFVFQGYDDLSGQELWFSDGTVEGTGLLVDLPSERRSSRLRRFIEWNGRVLFQTDTGLWITDGTAAGTEFVARLFFKNAVSVGDQLYMIASSPVGDDDNLGLWRTDGTTNGTTQINSVAVIIHIITETDDLVASNGSLYFRGSDGFHGNELFRLPLDDERIAGDSNGDGVFDSSDLVHVFQRGQYEDGIPNNSEFEDGDWNEDGEFDSSDLVFVFQKGNYVAEASRRNADAAFAAALDFNFDEDRYRVRNRHESTVV